MLAVKVGTRGTPIWIWVSIVIAGDEHGQGERWLSTITGDGHGLGTVPDLVFLTGSLGWQGCELE